MADKWNLEGVSVDTSNNMTVTGNVTAAGFIGGIAGGDGTFENLATSAVVIMSNLPTSDPTNAGQLWVDSTDGYTIKVSQG